MLEKEYEKIGKAIEETERLEKLAREAEEKAKREERSRKREEAKQQRARERAAQAISVVERNQMFSQFVSISKIISSMASRGNCCRDGEAIFLPPIV